MVDDEQIIIEPDETPEPAKKEPSKVDQFVEKLRAYATEEEAKTHIAEISQELGCAKSLGYKAIKNIKKAGGFTGQPTPKFEAKEPTARIETPPEQPLETDQETVTETETELGGEPEGIGQVAATPSELPLTPQALSETLGIFFDKIGGLTGYPEFALSKKEADALGKAWLPVLQMYLPQMMTNPLVWAGVCTTLVFLPKITGYVLFRRKTKPVIDVKKVENKPAPTPETPPTESLPEEKPPLETTIVTEEPAVKEKPKTAAFLEKL